MSISILLVITAVLGLAVIFNLTIKRSLQTKSESALSNSLRLVDMDAFRNLVNPAEDEYLRRRLRPAQFRAVRRERLRAMAAYIEVIAANAGVLVRAGQAALASGDPRLAEAAHALVNEALLLRRNTTVAMFQIYLALAWPQSRFAAVRVVDRYERLSGSAMLLGRLQNPAMAVRLSSRTTM